MIRITQIMFYRLITTKFKLLPRYTSAEERKTLLASPRTDHGSLVNRIAAKSTVGFRASRSAYRRRKQNPSLIIKKKLR